MASIVQLAGGPRVEQDQYTGQVREVTVVTDSKELRLHDGTTKGGIRILNITENDGRYHKLNDELNGIINLATQEALGVVTRIGDGTYRGRQIVGVSGEITIANPKGLAGDYTIGLPDTIADARTFSGVITFSQTIQGNLQGNVTGDLTGNVTGNLTGNVTGNVTGNLTGDAAGSHTGTFSGDVDVRGANLLLDDGQIAQSKIAGSLADAAYLVPSGGIILWSGSVAADKRCSDYNYVFESKSRCADY